jgi:hypothetical protein
MKIFRNKSLSRLTTGWTVQVSNPDGGEIFCPVQTDDKLQPALYNEYRLFPGKNG